MNPDCLVSEVARELSSQSPWPALSGGFGRGLSTLRVLPSARQPPRFARV